MKKNCCGAIDLDDGYIICFLAHSGIEQASVWDAWKEKADADGIRIVFHKILQDPTMSQWGSISVVRDTIRGLQELVREYEGMDPDRWRVFLVSGSDIPIRPPRDLLWIPSGIPLVCMSSSSYATTRMHSQFFSMTLGDIRKYFTGITPGRLLSTWKQKLPDLLLHQRQITMFPDLLFLNWFIEGVDRWIPHCTTLDLRRFVSSPNPITWTDLSTPRLVLASNLFSSKTGSDERIRISFSDAMKIVGKMTRRQPFLFFFRKVSRTMDARGLKELLERTVWCSMPQQQKMPEFQVVNWSDITNQQLDADVSEKVADRQKYRSRKEALRAFSQKYHPSDNPRQQQFLQSRYAT